MLENYADGKKYDGYDDDNYVDANGMERHINKRFKEVQRNDFHIGQSYDNENCVTLVCDTCGCDKFTVGTGSYFTAIKCDKCGWERCIHDG